jgi:hypothetical protein
MKTINRTLLIVIPKNPILSGPKVLKMVMMNLIQMKAIIQPTLFLKNMMNLITKII